MDLVLGVVSFTGIVLLLVVVILLARSQLVASGNVSITINGDEENKLEVQTGSKLLQTLADNKIFLSSACGGGGTCSQCKCQILEGGGSILPTEESHFNAKEKNEGWRLSCQVAVKNDLKITVPDDVFGVKEWECEVVSNDNVDYKDFDIEDEYHEDWDRFKIWDNKAVNNEPVIRAYSMANYPEEKGVLKFNIRIASPPPGSDFPPGLMSSWVFNLKPGDKVKVFGPFGEFFAKETPNEMVFVGGGAGMAPMRAHIFDQLLRINTDRKITFWYGARSLKEMFYVDEFDKLDNENDNFSWHVALSDPLPEDNWSGDTGFIHQVLFDNYLKNHPAPEDCEYYLCGPPMMNKAVIDMLLDLGVERENIALDDFGG